MFTTRQVIAALKEKDFENKPDLEENIRKCLEDKNFRVGLCYLGNKTMKWGSRILNKMPLADSVKSMKLYFNNWEL